MKTIPSADINDLSSPMRELSNKPDKLVQDFLVYVEKYKVRERNLPHSNAKHSNFDDDIDPVASRLAPHYSLHLNTWKRDQKTTRDTGACIV